MQINELFFWHRPCNVERKLLGCCTYSVLDVCFSLFGFFFLKNLQQFTRGEVKVARLLLSRRHQGQIYESFSDVKRTFSFKPRLCR